MSSSAHYVNTKARDILLTLFLIAILHQHGSRVSAQESEIALNAAPWSSPTVCGRQKALVRVKRIVNGNEAHHGQFPWVASIRVGEKHLCGGTVIGDDWILTAANCMQNWELLPYKVTVRAGCPFRTINWERHTQESKARYVIVHQDYKQGEAMHNIALVKLEKKFNFTSNVLPACLPASGDKQDYANMNGTIAGWGKFRKLSTYSQMLQYIEIPVVDSNLCTSLHQSNGTNEDFKLAWTQFCAGYLHGRNDVCIGDAGGGLLIRDALTNLFTVVGILIDDSSCGKPNSPAIYTKVAPYLSWVNYYMKNY